MVNIIKRTGMILVSFMVCMLIAACATYEADASTDVSSVKNISSGIQISWHTEDGAVGYIIKRKKAGQEDWEDYKKIESPSTSKWTDKSVKNGTKYQYKVCAIHEQPVLEGAEEGAEPVLAAADPGKSKKSYRVGNHSIKSLSSGSVGALTVKSHTNSYLSGYKVTYHKKGGSNHSIKVSGKTLSKKISKLSKGSTYYVSIQGYKKVDGVYYYGPKSATKSIKVRNKYYYSDNKYRQSIIDKALQVYHWRTSYIHGWYGQKTKSGRHGFDCSGYASYVLNHAMRKYIPSFEVSHDLVKLYKGNTNTSKVKVKTVCKGHWNSSKVKPGDLLFFDYPYVHHNHSTPYCHVGVYIGHGKFLHASGNGHGVTMGKMSYHKKYFYAARRYIPTK